MHILNLPQTALFGQNTWVSFSAYLCKTLFVVARFCLTAVFWDAHCFHVFVLCHKLCACACVCVFPLAYYVGSVPHGCFHC